MPCKKCNGSGEVLMGTEKKTWKEPCLVCKGKEEDMSDIKRYDYFKVKDRPLFSSDESKYKHRMNINTGEIFSGKEMKALTERAKGDLTRIQDLVKNYIPLSENDVAEVTPMSHKERKLWAAKRKKNKKE